MTGDWSEACRDIMEITGQGPMVGSFYVSFMLLVSLVLLNVVIAVLLEAFSKASSEESANIIVVVDAEGDKIIFKDKCPFERMAQTLVVIPGLDRMEKQIDDMWYSIIENGNGDMKNSLINFEQFQQGIMCLDLYFPPVVISENDFQHVKPFCNQNGYLGRSGFQGLMKTVVRKHQMRQLAMSSKLELCNFDSQNVKALMMGTMGLLRSEEDAHTSAGRILRASRRRMGRNQDQLTTETEKKISVDPVDKLLECLMNEVYKMDKRLDALEALCNSMPTLLNVDEEPTSEEPKKERQQGFFSRATSLSSSALSGKQTAKPASAPSFSALEEERKAFITGAASTETAKGVRHLIHEENSAE